MDPDTIIPYLNSKCLLSTNEFQELQATPTSIGKIDKIIEWLPRKGKGWWDKFLDCLTDTSRDASGHVDLVDCLKKALREVKEEGNHS